MPISAARLKPYKRRLFIETGTYAGDGVQIALDAGFEEILTIELHPIRFIDCSKRFENNKNVKLYEGDSVKVLANLIPTIKEPATLWLDAHGEEGYEDTVAGELEIIKQSGVKNHILLLDDIWESDTPSLARLDLPNRLYAINPDYKVYFIDGESFNGEVSNKTIMVAEPV